MSLLTADPMCERVVEGAQQASELVLSLVASLSWISHLNKAWTVWLCLPRQRSEAAVQGVPIK